MTLTQSTLRTASQRDARASGQAIAGFAQGDDSLTLTLTRANGERLEATVPAFALKILAKALSDNDTVETTELTTHQAAAMLHVSRPYLIKLLDEGRIPHRKVGKHRRIRSEDIRSYLDAENAARRQTLAELAAYDQERGLYDTESE